MRSSGASSSTVREQRPSLLLCSTTARHSLLAAATAIRNMTRQAGAQGAPAPQRRHAVLSVHCGDLTRVGGAPGRRWLQSAAPQGSKHDSGRGVAKGISGNLGGQMTGRSCGAACSQRSCAGHPVPAHPKVACSWRAVVPGGTGVLLLPAGARDKKRVGARRQHMLDGWLPWGMLWRLRLAQHASSGGSAMEAGRAEATAPHLARRCV